MDALHQAGWFVILVADPLEEHAMDGIPKLANQRRAESRAVALESIRTHTQAGKALSSVALSTLRQAVSVRKALQVAVLAAFSGTPDCVVLESVGEADFGLSALAYAGIADAIMSVDTDMLLHLSKSRAVLVNPRKGVRREVSRGSVTRCYRDVPNQQLCDHVRCVCLRYVTVNNVFSKCNHDKAGLCRP